MKLVSVPVHQSLVFPNLEPGPDAANVTSAQFPDSRLVVGMLVMLGSIDVAAVIKKVHSIPGHDNFYFIVLHPQSMIPLGAAQQKNIDKVFEAPSIN